MRFQTSSRYTRTRFARRLSSAIVSAVKRVTDIMAEISAASLEDQAHHLAEAVAVFRMDPRFALASAPARKTAAPAPAVRAKAPAKPVTVAKTRAPKPAVVVTGEEWAEFLATRHASRALPFTVDFGRSRWAHFSGTRALSPASGRWTRSINTWSSSSIASARNRELVQLAQELEERVQQRIRELVEVNRKLEAMSLTDVLTGLPNRRHAMLQLGTYWQQSSRDGQSLACLMLDADHFKICAADRAVYLAKQAGRNCIRSADA